MKPLPPLAVLEALYSYDASTGALTHRYTRGAAKAGDEVGCPHKGYRQATLTHEGITYRMYTHRICYALHHGLDPYPMEIDHINRNKDDNTSANLRAISGRDNKDNTDTPHKPIRITYPDGRNTIITDSVATASRILRIDPRKISRIARRNNNQLLYPHPTLPNTYIPTGIRIAYA